VIVIEPSTCDSCSTSIDVTLHVDDVGDTWHLCPTCSNNARGAT
jgi:hypothetical protein